MEIVILTFLAEVIYQVADVGLGKAVYIPFGSSLITLFPRCLKWSSQFHKFDIVTHTLHRNAKYLSSEFPIKNKMTMNLQAVLRTEYQYNKTRLTLTRARRPLSM